MTLPFPAEAATYYVAVNGSDAAAGTQTGPFASWARAQTAAAPGDTVYFRDGRYKYSVATSTCTDAMATVSAIVLSKSGTQANPIHYWAYPGEHPVFDFSGITDTSKYSCRQVGVMVQADWLHLKGLDLTGTLQLNNQNHESWCVYVDGGNNDTFEQLDAHHNMGPGFFLVSGGNNTFLNCDSHENEDTLTSNGDGQSADGFGCHPKQVGDTGNIFHGCRAWWNSDDSWDFIHSSAACTVEDSWAWYSGYKPDAIMNGQPVPLTAGNGNGFKGGGYSDPQTMVPAVIPLHVIRENLSFYNKASGLYANHEIVSPFFYNNTSFNNGTDINMLGIALNSTMATSVGILRNNIAYATDGRMLTSNMGNGGPISDEFNSWDSNLNLKITDADFESVAFTPPASCPAPYSSGGTVCCLPADTACFSGMASAPQADGSLPVLPFMRLSKTSSLIGKGTNVGLPFTGSAPDLGCFDHGNVGLALDAGTGSSGSGSSNDGGVSGSSGSAAGATSDDAGGSGTSGSSAMDDAGGASGSSASGVAMSGSTTGSASGSTGTPSDGAPSPSGSSAGSSGISSASGTAAQRGTEGEVASSAAKSGGCSVEPGSADSRQLAFVGLGILGLVGRRRVRIARRSSRRKA